MNERNRRVLRWVVAALIGLPLLGLAMQPWFGGSSDAVGASLIIAGMLAWGFLAPQ